MRIFSRQVLPNFHIGYRLTSYETEEPPLIVASYMSDRIRHALPNVPFKFGNVRVQRFEHLLFAKLAHKLFKLAFNLTSNRRSKLGSNISLRTTPTT